MVKKNYIIREVSPERCDFSYYFDDDFVKGNCGDFCSTQFIVAYHNGLNVDVLRKYQDQANEICSDFQYRFKDEITDSYKSIMEFYGVSYSATKCHKLKMLFCEKTFNAEDLYDMAQYLTIITGRKWDTDYAYGYCQGDYAEMLFCKDCYTHGVKAYGEVYLGAAKEFCVVFLDENGEECDKVYGYIVADCEANDDEDYKRLVCEWACISEEETQLEMIDGYTMQTVYSYRTA